LAAVTRTVVGTRELAGLLAGVSFDWYNFGVRIGNVGNESWVGLFHCGYSWQGRCVFTKCTTGVRTSWSADLKKRGKEKRGEK